MNDPGPGLATATHARLPSLPSDVTYVKWLGDDDLLRSGSLVRTQKYLDENSEVVKGFGSCIYIKQAVETI
jgi:hypothetical protein